MKGVLRSDLGQAAESIPELRGAKMRPPNITATGEMVIRHGGLTLRLLPLPGHSPDGIGVYIEEERILVAGDAVLPVPHFVAGDPDQLVQSLLRVRALSLNTIVQGHGDVILKGEVKEAIDYRLRYIKQVRRHVHDAVAAGATLREALRADIEAYGGSRLDLDGLTQQLHEDNVRFLYERYERAVFESVA
jgi:glyoxylase-like metal-dependent hydrolase (beta-lactamase superfamily II)